MAKVRSCCGQPSDRGWLKNRTEALISASGLDSFFCYPPLDSWWRGIMTLFSPWFFSTNKFLGRIFDRVDLIKPVSNVRLSVRAYVRPSTESLFLIWHVGRGWRVMHGGMQYDPIQGQGQDPFKVGKSGRFQRLSPPPFTMRASNWPRILKLVHNI